MKHPRQPLPPRTPCPVCDRTSTSAPRTPAEVTEDVKAHNLRVAVWGERSYRLAAALVLLLAGCGRPFSGPNSCPANTRADTIAVDSLSGTVAVRCVRRGVA
jgi:hypothetical protein